MLFFRALVALAIVTPTASLHGPVLPNARRAQFMIMSIQDRRTREVFAVGRHHTLATPPPHPHHTTTTSPKPSKPQPTRLPLGSGTIGAMDVKDVGQKALLLLSTIGSAAIGGITFGFASFVMQSLNTLQAPEVGRVLDTWSLSHSLICM